jgi:predicted PurR-regulated permease PerM
VTLAAWSFGFYSAVMLLLKFPHPIAFAILGGILEFVPVAGWITAAVAFVGVGAMTHSHWIWMAALLGVWRLIMDYYISPRVVGHNLEIHPLLVILAVMVGGEVDGIVGVYLSIPAIVVVRVLWQNYVKRQLQSAPELLTSVAEGVSNDRI